MSSRKSGSGVMLSAGSIFTVTSGSIALTHDSPPSGRGIASNIVSFVLSKSAANDMEIREGRAAEVVVWFTGLILLLPIVWLRYTISLL